MHKTWVFCSFRYTMFLFWIDTAERFQKFNLSVPWQCQVLYTSRLKDYADGSCSVVTLLLRYRDYRYDPTILITYIDAIEAIVKNMDS